MERGRKMEKENENLNFEETELRLGLPGGGRGGEGDHVVVMSTNNNGKRGFEEDMDLKLNLSSKVTAKRPAAKMFMNSCKRLRIMKGTEAKGLAPRAMEKCKNKLK
ncbi:hypothetical protein ACSBR1_012806 [Camellia fascicularis]